MSDVHSKKQRSYNMSRIKSQDTAPELAIRKALFQEGFRYRLHVKKMPGRPDVVFPKYKAVIFINGCFWHYHTCKMFKMPKERMVFWEKKLSGNRHRDIKNIEKLNEQGWRVLIVWECALRSSRKKVDPSLIKDIIGKIKKWIICNDPFMEIKGS